jgi:hypothetical protein
MLCVVHCRCVTKSCNTFSESRKITKFCYESDFSIISSVSLIVSASAVNVDAILSIINFQLIQPLIFIYENPTNFLFSAFESFVAKYSLVFIFS